MFVRKTGCKFCPSLISRGNITTNVNRMHGASHNCEQYKRVLKKLWEKNINIKQRLAASERFVRNRLVCKLSC